MSSGLVLEMSMEDAGPAPGDELAGSSDLGMIRTVHRASAPPPRIREDEEYVGPAGRSSSKSGAGAGAGRASDPTGVAQPGAYSATGRPVGAVPAWHRRIRRSVLGGGSGNRNSQANVPAELRSRPSRTSQIRQSVLNIFAGGGSSSVAEPSENVRGSATSASSRPRGRRSSAFSRRISSLFAGDAAVQTQEQIIEEQEEKNFKKEMWAVIACIAVVVVVAVGVSVGLTVGRGEPSIATPSPPTKAPTMGLEPESRRVISLRATLKHLSSEASVLEDRSSPQYSALVWLADSDEVAIDWEDSKRLEARYALATIYFATNGAEWDRQLEFLSPVHECEWSELTGPVNATEDELTVQGVSCNDKDEIVGLNLDDNNLQGFIPEEIKALTDLQYLSVASNTLRTGRSNLDAAASLQSISQLGSALTHLDVSKNVWDSIVPTSLTALSNLETLHLESNQFKFTIPSEFSRLSNLKELYMYENRLIGLIEDAVQSLSQLEVLAASFNSFTFSPDLRFSTTLTSLDLSENVLESSPLTSNIGLLSNLRELGLANVEYEGVLPTELAMLTELEILDLSGNRISGRFPWSILNSTSLRQLEISSCLFEDQLPSDIGRFANLERLVIERNFYDGPIPESIGNLASLQFLRLGSNFLSGPIPSTVGGMTSLKFFLVAFNELTGTIPSEMANMSSLVRVELQGNSFSGGDIEFLCSREVVQDLPPSAIAFDQNINCSCCQIV